MGLCENCSPGCLIRTCATQQSYIHNNCINHQKRRERENPQHKDFVIIIFHEFNCLVNASLGWQDSIQQRVFLPSATKKFGQPAASQMSRARLRCNLSAALRPYAA